MTKKHIRAKHYGNTAIGMILLVWLALGACSEEAEVAPQKDTDYQVFNQTPLTDVVHTSNGMLFLSLTHSGLYFSEVQKENGLSLRKNITATVKGNAPDSVDFIDLRRSGDEHFIVNYSYLDSVEQTHVGLFTFNTNLQAVHGFSAPLPSDSLDYLFYKSYSNPDTSGYMISSVARLAGSKPAFNLQFSYFSADGQQVANHVLKAHPRSFGRLFRVQDDTFWLLSRGQFGQQVGAQLSILDGRANIRNTIQLELLDVFTVSPGQEQIVITGMRGNLDQITTVMSAYTYQGEELWTKELSAYTDQVFYVRDFVPAGKGVLLGGYLADQGVAPEMIGNLFNLEAYGMQNMYVAMESESPEVIWTDQALVSWDDDYALGDNFFGFGVQALEDGRVVAVGGSNFLQQQRGVFTRILPKDKTIK